MSWEEFKKGHYSDDGKDEDSKEQMKEDEEKFKFADEDGDGKLDLEEYMAFYHPGVSNIDNGKKQLSSSYIKVLADRKSPLKRKMVRFICRSCSY